MQNDQVIRNPPGGQKALPKLLVLFFVLMWIFPSIRLLFVGAQTSNSVIEFIISAIPDLFIFSIYLLAAVGVHRTIGWGAFINDLNLLDKLFILFAGGNVLWGVWLANDPVISGYGFRLTYLATGFYFIGRVPALRDAGQMWRILRSYFLITVFFGILSWIIYFFYPEVNIGINAITGGKQLEYFVIRMATFIWSPTVFGLLMAMAALWFCFRLYARLSLVNMACLVITVSCMVMSVSRGPILAFLITFLLLTMFYRKELRTSLVSFGLILGTLVLIDLSLGLGGNLLKWLLGSTVDTFAMREGLSRVELWQRSYEAFLEKPLGYGLGKAGHVALRFQDAKSGPVVIYATDGWFLKIACETGIVGLLTYLAAAVAYVFSMVKSIARSRDQMLIFSLLIFLLVNATAVVSNTLDYYPYITIYWLLVGFSVQRMYHYRQ